MLCYITPGLTHYNVTHLMAHLPGTAQVSCYQEGKTNLGFTEARDRGWQWHHLDHPQICTLLQRDNHASTPSLSFFTGCPLVLERCGIPEDYFPGLESHGKQQRSWKVLKMITARIARMYRFWLVIMPWNFYNYTEKFGYCNVILVAVCTGFTYFTRGTVLKYLWFLLTNMTNY